MSAPLLNATQRTTLADVAAGRDPMKRHPGGSLKSNRRHVSRALVFLIEQELIDGGWRYTNADGSPLKGGAKGRQFFDLDLTPTGRAYLDAWNREWAGPQCMKSVSTRRANVRTTRFCVKAKQHVGECMFFHPALS